VSLYNAEISHCQCYYAIDFQLYYFLWHCAFIIIAAIEIFIRPVLRENPVPIDFIGFLCSWASCCRHADSAHDGGRTVSHVDRFRLVQQDGMDPDSRAQTAAGRVQAQVEETDDRKPGPAVLVLDLESLERMEIRADYGKTRNGVW